MTEPPEFRKNGRALQRETIAGQPLRNTSILSWLIFRRPKKKPLCENKIGRDLIELQSQ